MRKQLKYSLVTLSLLVACNNNPTPPPPQSSWQDFGGSEPQITNNSFQFPTSSSGTAGYFFKQTNAQPDQTLTLVFSIDGNSPIWAQHPQSGGATDSNPASLTLFLWRQGDDLGGDSTGKQSYRFWCPQRALLQLGNNQILSCKLDPNLWTNVDGQVDANGFAQALANQQGLGFTFGGASFYGHGVYLQSGTASFTINSFSVN